MTGATLIVGYGNGLRRDDGVGPHVVEALRADPRLADATILARQQLTPDLVVDISVADFVVFIDATVTSAPGVVRVTPLAPAGPGAAAWSHHLEPATLVALASEMYGPVPTVVVVSVGIADTDAGEGLSPLVEAAVAHAVAVVAGLVAARASTMVGAHA